MNTFELNKIAGALLMALLVTTVIGHLGNILVHPKMPAQNAYVVAGVGAEAKGGTQTAAAPAALAPIAPLLAAANPEAGKATFKQCASCHTPDKGGKNGVCGPELQQAMLAEPARDQQKDYESMLAHATCMRDNGVSRFANPTMNGGNAQPGGEPNPASPVRPAWWPLSSQMESAGTKVLERA